MAGYIGSRAAVATSGVERKKTFTITTTTTSLTGLDYTPNHVHVFHNGIRLVDGTDYTASNGTSITLVNAAENGDEVVVVSYATFQPSDTVSASLGGTFNQPITVEGDAATVLTVDRATSDGTLVDFKKNGTTVGSIGVFSSDNLGITGSAASHAGVIFGTNQVLPASSGTYADAAVDVGNTTTRFKNLYLSGGVYLGGTGAANLLDDYEEGTFTAQMFDASSGGNASSSTSTGKYTKIGQLVFATFSISNVDTSGLTAGNDAYFALPFTNNGGVVAVGSVRLFADVDDPTVSLASQVLSGHDRVSIVRSRDNTGLAEVLVSMFNSGLSDMSISIVYHT